MATGRPDTVTIERAFSEEDLGRIEALCEGLALEHLVEGPVEGVDHNRRDVHVGLIAHTDETAWLFMRLMPLLQRANAQLRVELWGIAEQAHYRVYEAGRDCWHRDSTLPRDDVPHLARKLTFELMLSAHDEYQGGERQFLGPPKFTAARGRGILVVFPSFLLTRVNHVTGGRRRSIEGWVCGPEFK